jgi:hypothetical protein
MLEALKKLLQSVKVHVHVNTDESKVNIEIKSKDHPDDKPVHVRVN